MDRASSLIFPGSRTLAGWWRQLQPCQPHSLHVGYGYVHRIDALVQVARSQPIDSCTHLILQALSLKPSDGAHLDEGPPLDELCRRLPLPPAVLQQMLLGMEKTGLLAQGAASGWTATERGRLALAERQYPVHVRERRHFSFLEHLNALGERIGPPRFLPIAECASVAWHVEEPLRFDPATLQACIAESPEWKRARGFPLEVESLVQDGALPAWEQVIVDRPERLLFVLTLAGKAEAAELLGFAARADGWTLYEQTPIVHLPAAALGKDLNLLDDPSMEVCQDAWRSWCKQCNLPLNEVDSCSLKYQPPRLEVQAPERFVQRLRAAKSDLLKGEAWLVFGDGYLRTGALLSLPAGM